MSAWLQGLLTEPASVWVENVQTEVRAVRWGESFVPLTINDTEWESSYVCSPYTAFVSYAREELAKLRSPALETALGWLIGGLDLVLRQGRINRVVHVNNWLLSTNLYPPLGDPEALHHELRRDYPDHTLLFRSLNRVTNGALMDRLQTLGYRLIPSRQVYLFDFRRGDFREPKNFRWDERWLSSQSEYRVSPLEVDDYPRAVELYNLLYLRKYSIHNPHFSRRLVELWHRSGALRMWGLRSSQGRLDGVVGILQLDEVTTVPLVGYDTSLPPDLGLYRMLMSLALQDAREARLLLNLSAGAAHFKRIRGGQACLEYSAAYYRHLPWGRRLVWMILDGLLTGIGAPVMKRFKL